MIVCGFTMIAALLSLFAGLQLQNAVQKNRQDFELQRIAAYYRFRESLGAMEAETRNENG